METPDAVPPAIAETKQLRADIKELVTRLQKAARKSRSRSTAVTKLEEAGMWLGKDLQEINEESPGSAPDPYPESRNPASARIELPAE